MHNDSSSGLTTFEASNADRPFWQSRYGKFDFDYFFRNQPRYKAHPGKGAVGGNRVPGTSQLFVNDL